MVEIEAHTSIKRLRPHGEKPAAYMADGYARASHRPGICLCQDIGTTNLAAGLRDALTPSGLGAAPTFPSPNPAVRLDYVFVSADVEPVTGAIPRTTASDHLPVVAQIRLR